ncbi:hypothetical protein CFO_g3480 [Ceratocystis platani]|uniref:Fe2OG dioxygenase domain-containing protein n=1 Tax=Ceratocystis fimbriata f. sp. platani TaxID=88771 RepID=A0A0F8DDX2_CERFI|nr:hypothetical protein CFO_g3480 [Ceratocystis platani]
MCAKKTKPGSGSKALSSAPAPTATPPSWPPFKPALPVAPLTPEPLTEFPRKVVQDAAFAQRLWEETGLQEALREEGVKGLWDGEPIGLNPNIRIYRYTKGQFFDAHYDDWNPVSLSQGSSTIAAKTTWTLLLYLTSVADGCTGGETVFYPFDRRVTREEVAVAPETGMVLLHKHGDECMLHEGREVTAGEKWIIRTDICVPR